MIMDVDASPEEAFIDTASASSVQSAIVTAASLGSGNKSNEEKTKRLLSLARSKLEENQKLLAEKDLYIAQLVAALEEEKLQHTRLKRTATKDNDDSNNTVPRNILRRVDADDIIWILIEYDGNNHAFLYRLTHSITHSQTQLLTIFILRWYQRGRVAMLQ